jgi:hypothetical protein
MKFRFVNSLLGEGCTWGEGRKEGDRSTRREGRIWRKGKEGRKDGYRGKEGDMWVVTFNMRRGFEGKKEGRKEGRGEGRKGGASPSYVCPLTVNLSLSPLSLPSPLSS